MCAHVNVYFFHVLLKFHRFSLDSLFHITVCVVTDRIYVYDVLLYVYLLAVKLVLFNVIVLVVGLLALQYRPDNVVFTNSLQLALMTPGLLCLLHYWADVTLSLLDAWLDGCPIHLFTFTCC